LQKTVVSPLLSWGSGFVPVLVQTGVAEWKTMLRRYEALGGAVALPLSKRGAGLLSMVFCAKAANPQELVAIEMGNQA